MKFLALFFFLLSLGVPLQCFFCRSCSKQCAELRAQITLDPLRLPLRGKAAQRRLSERCQAALGKTAPQGRSVRLLLFLALPLSSFALYPPTHPTPAIPPPFSQSDGADQNSLSGHSPSTSCTGEEKPGGSQRRRDGRERLLRPLLPVFIPRALLKKDELLPR